MWRWIGSLMTSAAVLALTRWMFRISRPAEDARGIERFIYRVAERLREFGRILWRYYGPVNEEMRERWTQIRERYQRGEFGVEGT